MTLRHRAVASLGLIGALGFCFTATAQPGAPGDKPAGKPAAPAAPAAERREAREETKEAAKDAREERKEAAKDAREERKEAAEEARDEKKDLKERLDDAREKVGEKLGRLRDKKYPAVAKEQVAKRQAKLDARLAELKKDRAERRKAIEEDHKKKYGDAKDQPAALRAEMRHHAWRMARLEAIRRIAQDEGKTDTVARVDKLIEKENERHTRKMENLKSAAPAGSASAGAPATSGKALGKGGPGGPPPGRDIAASRPDAQK